METRYSATILRKTFSEHAARHDQIAKRRRRPLGVDDKEIGRSAAEAYCYLTNVHAKGNVWCDYSVRSEIPTES
jgi:hypothetical protein